MNDRERKDNELGIDLDMKGLTLDSDEAAKPQAQNRPVSHEDMARMKNSSSYKVAIYNQTGSLMKQVSMTNKTISINTTEFPNGIYFIHLMDNTGEKIGSKKISISH